MQGESNSTDEPVDAAARDEGEGADPSTGEAGGDPTAPSSADPLAEAKAEAAKMKDAWLRTAADFDNFRKRSRKELDDARRGGREDLLRALLPVFDNLERAIQSAQRAVENKAMVDGLAMVQRQFVEALAREGITRVATVGQAFDPAVHEAIQQVETTEHAPGSVLAEVQAGYAQGERLVRAALVVVAKAKAPGSEAGAKEPS
jgi:molecular chaperone GrpE